MNINPTIATDSYKLTHWKMLPKDVDFVYSYFESRKGAKFNKTVFFGLQYLLKKYLTQPITQKDINEGQAFTDAHIGPNVFNRGMWQHILSKYDGYMPLRIRAVPEGTPVDVNNVLMTVQNTDPLCAPLTNHWETLFCHVWAPSTVATLSREVKILCDFYLKGTSDNPDHLNFMLHDFGYRGVNQSEAAGICGAAHLINFMGTDTIEAMRYAMEYYNADLDGLAYSVPASEHSVMTALLEQGEPAVFEQMLHEFPSGILSVVIDSYDYRNFIDKYARRFKDMILGRDGKTVFRPDSGDPVSTTIEVLELLDGVFGSSVNSKGYKALNPKVGMLWGDGIDYQGIRDILFAMKSGGWAADNIVFGMGGGLLQKVNRDDQRFAFKCSAQMRNGGWRDVYKKPLDASKASKKGRLGLYEKGNGVFSTDEQGLKGDLLEVVYEDGKMKKDFQFSLIRDRAEI